MTQYVHVEAGQIDEGPKARPKSYVNKAANVNVSGLDHSTDAQLRKMGWLPVEVQADPAFNPATQKLGPPTYEILATKVKQTATVVPLTESELSEAANAQADKARFDKLVPIATTAEAVERVNDIIAYLRKGQ